MRTLKKLERAVENDLLALMLAFADARHRYQRFVNALILHFEQGRLIAFEIINHAGWHPGEARTLPNSFEPRKEIRETPQRS